MAVAFILRNFTTAVSKAEDGENCGSFVELLKIGTRLHKTGRSLI